MNTRETALGGLLAALSSIVLCQFFVRAVHRDHLSSGQIAHGLAIGLAGVAVGLLLVVGASLLQEAGSAWLRSLGTFGLALGGALLLALFATHRPLHANPTPADSTPADSTFADSTDSKRADATRAGAMPAGATRADLARTELLHAESARAESTRRATQGSGEIGTLLLAPGAWR